jgi:hypothetical protein
MYKDLISRKKKNPKKVIFYKYFHDRMLFYKSLQLERDLGVCGHPLKPPLQGSVYLLAAVSIPTDLL